MTQTARTPADLPAIPPALEGLALTLSVRIGTVKKTVGDLTKFTEGLTVALDSPAGAPVEICVEDRVIARGDLIESPDGEGLAVKVTSLADPDTPL